MAMTTKRRRRKPQRGHNKPCYDSPGKVESQCWFPPLELAALVSAGALDRDATVLDVGCGSGIEAIFLSRMGWKQVYGIDQDEEAVSKAVDNAIRLKAQGLKFDQADLAGGIPALPADWPKSFGLVLDRLCINNFIANAKDPSMAHRNYFGRMSELVCKGGTLLLRDRFAFEHEATFRRSLFSAKPDSDLFEESGGERFFRPKGPVLSVRLVGDDTEDYNRFDAMVPIMGTMAVLERV